MKKSVGQTFKVFGLNLYLHRQKYSVIDFSTIEYLKTGTARQQSAYRVLTENKILKKLEAFDPLLTGTIPINIDIESSDLDIICYFQDANSFRAKLEEYFKPETGFKMFIPRISGAVAVTFTRNNFIIEIFGQSTPTREQNAWRHMLIEHKILQEKGEEFRKQIIELKRQGYKTEPAFGKLLGITGNVYEELLSLEKP